MSLGSEALAILAAGAKGAAAGSVVPGLGTGVGAAIGVAAELIPDATRWLGADDATRTKVAATVQAVTGFADGTGQRAALAADPGLADDLKVQLQQIANERQAEENRSAEARQAAAAADTAGARTQTLQLAQAGSAISWGAPVVSTVVALGFFAAFGLLIYAPAALDAGRTAMLNILVGVLGSGFTATLGYWLGSSAGSARKTELMAQQTPVPPSPGVVVPASDVQPAR